MNDVTRSRLANGPRSLPALAVALLLIALAAPAVPAQTTSHHIRHRVRNAELTVQDKTRYNDALRWGMAEWNAMGSVRIYTVASNARVRVEDYDSPDGYCGWYDPDGAIYMNVNCLGPSPSKRRATAAHEFGHAVGIGDHYSGYSTQLMYHLIRTHIEVPKKHDKYDYRSIWGPTGGGCVANASQGQATCSGQPLLGDAEPDTPHVPGLIPDTDPLLPDVSTGVMP
jgi:snapalysin